ncbi:MAG: helix-turn-helix transcriptional regulator [Geminicoccaceae bacterium]|nr:helix-turn-helix transcriptional regulator [Geminicoccaceae bacterium]
MTADELRTALDELSLTQSSAARRWGVDIRTIQRWCSGERAIPSTVEKLVALELGLDPVRIAELNGERRRRGSAA